MKVEITNISKHGFWLLYDDHEYFVPFQEFPLFLDKTIKEILDVKDLGRGHLFWESLDIDLSLDMIENYQRYPLKAKITHTETI